MSGNSNSEGAPFRPRLPGYSGEWDAEVGVWVFRRDDDPDVVLRGRNQDELNAARARRVAELSGDLLAINRYAAANAYTPPPRRA